MWPKLYAMLPASTVSLDPTQAAQAKFYYEIQEYLEDEKCEQSCFEASSGACWDLGVRNWDDE